VSCRTRRVGLAGEIGSSCSTKSTASLSIISRNGWVTSVPGWAEVTLETLWGSLPDELCQLGYDVQQIGEG
jgi:hypothetical protein